jgi:hypothetical protein
MKNNPYLSLSVSYMRMRLLKDVWSFKFMARNCFFNIVYFHCSSTAKPYVFNNHVCIFLVMHNCQMISPFAINTFQIESALLRTRK